MSSPAVFSEELLFESIVENTPAGICVVQDDVAKYVNGTFSKMTEYSWGDLIGKTAYGHIHPDDRARFSEKLTKRFVKGSFERAEDFIETRCVSKTGKITTVEVFGSAIAFEGRPAKVLYYFDVTYERIADAQLRQFANIITQMMTGVYIFRLDVKDEDSSLRLINANPAAFVLAGHSKFDMVGRRIDEIFPRLREKGVPEKLAETVRKSVSFEVTELLFSDASSASWVSFKTLALPDNCVCVLFEDITEKKKAVEETENQIQLTKGIIDSSNEPIFSVDKALRYNTFNSSHAALMERKGGSKIAPGTCILDFLNSVPEERASLEIFLKRALSGERFSIDSECSGDSEDLAKMETLYNPITSIDGSIIGVSVFARKK